MDPRGGIALAVIGVVALGYVAWFLPAPAAGAGGQFLLFAVAFAVYFLPPWVAAFRRHHNATAIFVLTLLLGWTGLGWVAALVWAFTVVRKPEEQRDRAGTE